MANHKAKPELTWTRKENQPRLGPRILIEDLPAPHPSRQVGRIIPDKPRSRLQKYRVTGIGKRVAEGRSR